MLLVSNSFSLGLMALVALVAHTTVEATEHTLCYRYFLQNDGCVFSTNDPNKRCNPDGHPTKQGVGVLKGPASKKHRRDVSLARRYDTLPDSHSFYISDGTGICGAYRGDQPGACLWAGGQDSQGNPTGGWLNGTKTSNCGKQLYLQRQGKPDTVQVYPCCDFNIRDETPGCFQIAVTEHDKGYLTGLTWDFNNLYGDKTRNGPV
ncbi:secreted protein [Melampsora americana]|nr:secreted protein [Melampsora americana]